MEVKDRKFAIIGFGRSGQAIAKLLYSKGGMIFVSENKHLTNDQKEVIAEYNFPYETNHTGKILNCDYAIVSPGISFDNPVVKRLVEFGVTVLPEIEAAYRLTKNRIIGVTGTNGKSTTSHLTCQILSLLGNDVKLGGNISPGKPFAEVVMETLDKKSLIVCELSSFQLEHISKFKSNISVLTNISDDHFDRHPNMDSYVKAKMMIFKNHTKDDFAVLNYDDPLFREMDIPSRKIYVSGREAIKWIYFDGKNIVFNYDRFFNIVTEEFRLLGMHNIFNLMMSLAAAYIVKPFDDSISDIIGELKGLEHRLEYVRTFAGRQFYNNSMCTNPEAFEQSLRSFSKEQTVILGGRNKNFDIDKIMHAVSMHANAAVLIGEVSSMLEEKLRSIGYENAVAASSLEDAVKTALRYSQKGEYINFSPGFASFDMFKDFQDRGNKFKEIVRKLK